MGKTNRHHPTVVILVCLNSLQVIPHLDMLKLDKGLICLQYDMMKLINHSNAENKVRKKEDKGGNTYSILAS